MDNWQYIEFDITWEGTLLNSYMQSNLNFSDFYSILNLKFDIYRYNVVVLFF
jgi:hypothetical protein